MNKPWKLVLLLVGIFLAGGVAGSFLTFRFGRPWIVQRAAPEQWTGHHLRKLEQKLTLTPQQVDELRPIVRRNMEELSRLRTNSMNANRTVMERMEREVAARLTPEQRVKFEEFIRERRERLQKAMEHGKPGERREGKPPASPDGKDSSAEGKAPEPGK